MLLTTYTYDYQWPSDYDIAIIGGTCVKARARRSAQPATTAQQSTPRAINPSIKETNEAPLTTEEMLSRMEWIPNNKWGRLLEPKLLFHSDNEAVKLALAKMEKSNDFNFVPCEDSVQQNGLDHVAQLLKSDNYKLYNKIQAEKMEKWNTSAIGRTVAVMKEKHKLAQDAKAAAACAEQRLNGPTQQQLVLATRMDSIVAPKEPSLNRWKETGANKPKKRMKWG